MSRRDLLAKIVKKAKGFLKDPFLYLGLAATALFVLISFIPGILEEKSAFLSSNLSQEQLAKPASETNDLFVISAVSELESPDFSFIQGNSLIGAAPTLTVTPQVLGVLLGEAESGDQRTIIEYQVQSGDTLGGIADKFGVSLNTLLWANDLSQVSKIKTGQNLIILPVSGVLHYVKAGDTISEIAKKYKADSQDIVSFNELLSEDDIFIGDILIIPGGTMPSQPKTIYAEQIPVASSYFICPIASPCRITQGLHFSNAIDFSNGKCGDSIYAAAGGTVQRVKYGWNGGAGNTLTILHPNGVVTSYGHILTSLVNPGEQVYQGQIVALVGGQPGAPGAGKSTGCHVHFGAQGAKNPFAK